LAIALGVATATAGAAELAFKPAEPGFFAFDTGVVRGKLRLDGRSQGVASLVHVATGKEITYGGEHPGIFSPYRVFSTDTRYGHAARDWPAESKLLEDGAVSARWPAADDHPVEITGVYRWSAPDTLDLELTVRPRIAMPRFELFLSSYFSAGFDASVYVKPNRFAQGEPRFLRADVNDLVDGTYLMFPRDREAALMIFDRRWERPPNPVQWSVTCHLAAPLAVRKDDASGLAAVMMAPAEDCFAVATPYNKTPPDGVAGHKSLYLSLFGRDLGAGQTARARCRLVVGRELSDRQIIERYFAYVRSLQDG
jgi:hypothetical protein